MPEQDGEDLTVAGNLHLLEIAVINLIRNAIRFSPKGERVEITVAADGNRITVRVSDRGPGIPPANLERVFDRYFSMNEGRTSGGGAGLGLAITRGITKSLRSGPPE